MHDGMPYCRNQGSSRSLKGSRPSVPHGTNFVLFVFVAICVVFCLLVVLVELSVLAKWLARKTPLRKRNRGEGIISRKLRPKSAHDFLGLLYCFIVLLCICVVSCPYVTYYPTVMVRYSLFVLKVPLNPKQTNKQHPHWEQHCSQLDVADLCHCRREQFFVVSFRSVWRWRVGVSTSGWLPVSHRFIPLSCKGPE